MKTPYLSRYSTDTLFATSVQPELRHLFSRKVPMKHKQKAEMVNGFIKHLKDKYPMPNVKVNLDTYIGKGLPSYVISDFNVGIVNLHEGRNRADIHIALGSRPVAQALRTTAHEYMHVIQCFVQKRDFDRDRRLEKEADDFGFDEVHEYLTGRNK